MTMVSVAFIEAASEGNTRYIMDYIAGDANCSLGYIGLNTAAQAGQIETVRTLLEAGAHINGNPLYRAIAPLIAATEWGQIETVSFLIERQADVNAQTSRGQTALMFAVKHRVTEDIFDLLIAHGAKVKAADQKGQTPLIYAMQSDSIRIVRTLVNRGADVTAVDINGCSALHFATNAEIIRYLVACGTDVNMKDKRGNTCLMEAAKAGNNEAIKAFLECGADIQYMNQRTRRSALRNALSKKHRDTALLLVEKGADLEERDATGATSYEWAVENGWTFMQDEIKAVAEQMRGSHSAG